MDSSFKVWRMTGEMVYEYKTNENQELWQVLWQPGTFARGERPPLASTDGSAPGKREKNERAAVHSISVSFFR